VIELASTHLLFIDPKGPQKVPAVIDTYTRRMTGALRSR